MSKFIFMCERKLLIITLMASFLSLFVAANASAAGKIAFSSDRDGDDEIYVMNADGSGQTQLTVNTAMDRYPSCSPDGLKIAFTSDRDGNFEIYVMNADGSGQTPLTINAADDRTPAWSPDGSKIAFASTRDGNPEIYVMNADGSGQTRLTTNATYDWEPTWSPDGLKIAFTTFRDSNYEIYVMNADGSGQTRLTANADYDAEPAWSPDGLKIAFTSRRDGNEEIYVMNADGSGQTPLTINAADERNSAWSPDGSKIAFASTRDGNFEVYVMNADGSGQTWLTTNAANDLSPAWSPEVIPPTCGDGIIGNTPGETCDPPGGQWPPNGNPCDADCTFCGDGNTDADEACDDRNGVNTDACRNDCTLQPDISVSPSSLAFGKVIAGVSSTSKNVAVSNTGAGTLAIGVITLTGTNPDQFRIPVANDNCSGQLIAPAGSCTVDVKFSPTSTGAKNATLSIPSDDPDPAENPASVSLSGNAVKVIVTSPNGGESWKWGPGHSITWSTSSTIGSVATTKIYYTMDGGTTWKLIATLSVNLGTYTWYIPKVTTVKNKCKVKVVLKNTANTTIGSDISDKFFTIKP